MTTEERTRFEVLLENVQIDIRVIAEAQGALVERMDRTEARLDRHEARFDRLDLRVAVLDTKVDALDAKVDALDAKVDARFANIQQWIERIATHLGLDGVPRPGTRPRRGTAKRRKPS